MIPGLRLILSFVGGAACMGLALLVLTGPGPYELPQGVLEQTRSPSGSQTALVLEADHHRTWMDLFGSDQRFFLALRRGDVTCILDRELSDGFGFFEGGIGTVTWEGDSIVVLERWVNDRKANLSFDTDTWTWADTP